MVQYADLERCVFHVGGQSDQWLELAVSEQAVKSFAANMVAEGRIFIKINTQIVNEKYKLWRGMKEQGEVFPEALKIEKNFDPCEYLLESNQTLRNFEINIKYNKAFSSDFLNFDFVEPHFRELLEYHTIGEFNLIRGKEFIGF